MEKQEKKPFSTKVRWYTSNPSIAKVDKNGNITAGTKTGTCNVYAKSHNETRTKIQVIVWNYAKVKNYYNYGKENDIYVLITDYKTQIQNIAEYYSIHRINKGETILFTLDNDAQVIISPSNADIGKLRKDIETLLVIFPYFISVEIGCDGVTFELQQEDNQESLTAYVDFFFNRTCNEWPNIQIASHWTAYRFQPI